MTRLNSTSENKTDPSSNITQTNDLNELAQRRRSIFTVEKLNERYNLNQNFNDAPIQGTWNYVKKYYKPTPAFFKRQLFKRIPFLDWIRSYNMKEWLVSDLVSGITIGIVHIPQGKSNQRFDNQTICSIRIDVGLGYAILAGLPPVTGLYVSFFPVILYALLGSSRHLSVGKIEIKSFSESIEMCFVFRNFCRFFIDDFSCY